MTGPEFKSQIVTLGLSQSKFAGRIGVKPSTVSDWVNDKARVPGYAIYVVKLLNAIEDLKESVK